MTKTWKSYTLKYTPQANPPSGLLLYCRLNDKPVKLNVTFASGKETPTINYPTKQGVIHLQSELKRDRANKEYLYVLRHDLGPRHTQKLEWPKPGDEASDEEDSDEEDSDEEMEDE